MIRWVKLSFLLSTLFFANALLADDAYITVPDGNETALRSALFEASNNAGITTIILTGGEFQFGPDDELPEVRTSVSIIGYQRPAWFRGEDGGPSTLLRVGQSGSLALSNVAVENFDLIATDSDSGDSGLIVNMGSLTLKQVQFRDNTADITCSQEACTASKPLLANGETGELRLAEVSIVDSGAIAPGGTSTSRAGAVLRSAGTARLLNVQLYLQSRPYDPPISNSGQMWLRHVSFQSEGPHDSFEQEFIVSSGRLQVANSVFAGFAADWCNGVISAGYNLVDNPQCAISSREDIVGKSAGLRWKPVEANWRGREEQILTHALVPIAASPAVDSANDAWCPDTSLHLDSSFITILRPLDGDDEGAARCDRGAVEIMKSLVYTGGINGLYFNPEADGHYVYVADTEYNTMVMWTTFDADGDQAWIFGIAEKAVAGRSLIADAYINRDGRVSLSGQFDPATSEHWGRIEFELTSCNDGEFSFFSDVPEFGSGRFDITRLAQVKRLGCVSDVPDE